MGDEREGLQGWETRDAGSGLSYIERGTGAKLERFLAVPLLYGEAAKVEDLLGRVGQLTQELEQQGDWFKEVERLRESAHIARERAGKAERRITELEARGWELLDAIRKADNLGIAKAAGSLRAVLSTSKEQG